MQGFCDALAACNLIDLGFMGEPVTWTNSTIKCCLDQCVATPAWKDRFGFLRRLHSDHVPLLLSSWQNHVSLSSRLLKEKKFPHNSF